MRSNGVPNDKHPPATNTQDLNRPTVCRREHLSLQGSSLGIPTAGITSRYCVPDRLCSYGLPMFPGMWSWRDWRLAGYWEKKVRDY